MERFNGLNPELRFAATLAQSIVEQNIPLSVPLVERWIHEGFVNEKEMEQIIKFVEEWKNETPGRFPSHNELSPGMESQTRGA